MKGKRAAYWVSTLLFAAYMGSNVYAYLTHDPRMMVAFASLGYPPYFPTILGVAKLLGIIVVVIPGTPQLKEWAYAGFTFTFLGAIMSQLASGQKREVTMPIVALIIIALSYLLRPPLRRIVEAAAVL
jgi:hypothetical protein